MSLYKDEKGMPFMNFKIVKAKKLNMECKKTTKIWHIYSLRFWVRSFGGILINICDPRSHRSRCNKGMEL